MPKIHVLPDTLIDQIAAGEVVERPASVVKELVENAIDAGARRIAVALTAGGRDSVEITDDGCGMEPEDARRALHRHATSKIAAQADLDAIATFGFRGEALPSIAAAARLVLETAAVAGAGVRIEVEFGRLLDEAPASRPRGTRVAVCDLFLRLPARRKFLRSEATELRHALAALHAIAFARPDIALAVANNGRTLLDLPPASDFSRRLPDLVGPARARQSTPFSHAHGAITVYGCLLPPRGQREVVLAVNGRPVRDRLVLSAVSRALRGPGGMAEADAFVGVDLPLDLVDVNVHPTKAEVRFADPGRVIAAVSAAVAGARAAMHGPAPIRRIVTVPAPPSSAAPQLQWGARAPTGAWPAAAASPAVREAPPAAGAWDEAGAAARPAPGARLLGQYRGTYLVLEDRDGLLLVDQHAAHERVLYERLLCREDGQAAQRLLVPELIDLSPARAALAAEVAGDLLALGVEVETVSGNCVRVHAMPAGLPAARAGALVAELLADIDGAAAPGATVRERAAASLACRAAVKKHTALAQAEVDALLADLAGCREPHRCPHGRPIVVRLHHAEIERRIGRR